MKRYYIYFHRDTETGNVFYVGMADSALYARKYHRAFTLNDKERNKFWTAKFNSLKKGISIEIVEEFSDIEECKKREIYFIEHFRKHLKQFGETLTNIADGGDDKGKRAIKVAQYNLAGELIKVWSGVPEAVKNTNVSEKAIYQCLEANNSNRSSGCFMWRWVRSKPFKNILPFKDKRLDKSRKIKAIHTNSKIESMFNSVSDAAKILKLDTSSIFKCIKGERKTCQGYRFELIN